MTFYSSPEDELTRGTVFQAVARLRAGDSKVLFREGHNHGAIYLAGYAVECQLKYAVCERNELKELPARVKLAPNKGERSLYVHDWSLLLVAAQLRGYLEKMESLFWELNDEWGPALRYRTKTFRPGEASRLYSQIFALYSFFAEIQP